MAIRRWVWSKIAGRFRKGNREASGVELRDAFAARTASSAADLAARLGDGSITLAAWSAEMATRVRSATIGQFLLGIGGKDNLTPLLRMHVSDMVGEQLAYLRNFAREIGAGALTVDQIAARSSLYFDTTVGAYEQGRALALGVVMPQYPPAHALCRCFIRYDVVGRNRTASWITSADERVCPICTGLEGRYADVVIGAV